MSQEESTLLDQWTADTSFINWARNIKGRDYEQWESWLSENPEKRPLAEIGRQMIKGIPFQPMRTNKEQDEKHLGELWAEIHKRESHSVASAQASTWRRFTQGTSIRLLAAMITLLCATATFFYFLNFSEEIIIKTAYGEKKTFMLPDRSAVSLNANSSLRYNESQPRKVWLEGEAFFKVSKQPVKQDKFWVITRDLTIEVLGTAFNVNSHQEKTKVYLEEGKVKLNLKSDSVPDIVLHPGEMLTYSRKKATSYERKRTTTQLESSWKAGTQLFEKTPLSVILDKMEEIYGVNIKLRKQELENRLITMGIPVENFDIALATIEQVLGVKVIKIDHGHYYIE